MSFSRIKKSIYISRMGAILFLVWQYFLYFIHSAEGLGGFSLHNATVHMGAIVSMMYSCLTHTSLL